MQVSVAEYERLELRAHAVLAGVPIHDVWAVDLPGGGPGRTLADLRPLFSLERLMASARPVRILFALRAWLGRVFGWDAAPPGAADESYVHRLAAEDREASIVRPGTTEGPARVLLVHEREAIAEIHNATVHAFVVFALVERGAGYRLYWGVYVRPTGRFTSWYMALIGPFRRWIVYPALLRYVRDVWTRRTPVVSPAERGA